MSDRSIQQIYSEHRGKVSDKWALYLEEYDRILGEYRDRPIALLEIGIQNGGSLEIWSKYFANARTFVGCDSNPDCASLMYEDRRIRVVVGDANSDAAYSAIREHAATFDIIIDDGSHRSSDVVKSFAKYFPLLADDGIYIVEDLHTSYWEEYEGGLFDPFSSVAFFKRLSDLLNYDHWGIERTRLSILDAFFEKYGFEITDAEMQGIHSIEFINSMCIIRRAAPEKNRLGKRIVAGQTASIWPPVLEAQREEMPPAPAQSNNPWSVQRLPADEEVGLLRERLSEKEAMLQRLAVQVARKEQALLARIAEKEQAAQALAKRLAAGEEEARTLAKRLARQQQEVRKLSKQLWENRKTLQSIYSSESWAVVDKLQRIRAFLVPHGSIRARVGRLTLRGIQVLGREGPRGIARRLKAHFFLDDLRTEVPPAVRRAVSSNRPAPAVTVVIPTKDAGSAFRETLKALKAQEYAGQVELVVIDSGSRDRTREIAAEYGAVVINIPPEEFDHGLTRNRAIQEASGDIIVLMSQDVTPGNQYLVHNFATAFEDPQVAGAYARQLPRQDADATTKRKLNAWLTGRPDPEVRSIEDWGAYYALSPMRQYYFCNFDNVCSAVRKSAWQTIPFRANEFGEDIDWAQRVLEAGWKIAYWPDSYVFHSHRRSPKGEYSRNYLCHKKLYTQFRIHSVPAWRDIIRDTLVETPPDWDYALRHEKASWSLLVFLAKTPFMNFASFYGQYRGAEAAIRDARLRREQMRPSDPMRIILTVHQFFPEYSSGTEVLTLETAKELKRLGHDVSVFTAIPAPGRIQDKDRFDRYTVDGLQVVRYRHNLQPIGGKPYTHELEYRNPFVASYFRNYLIHEKPDLVSFFHLSRLSAALIDVCEEMNVPTTMTPTDFWCICPTSQLRLPDNQPCLGPDASSANCLRHLAVLSGVNELAPEAASAISGRHEYMKSRINRIGRIVAPTQTMLSLLVRNGVEESRITLLPFGLNLAHMGDAKRPAPSEALRLGYIGTLSEHKGVHVLIQAVKKLASEPILLKIYGDPRLFPKYFDELQKLADGDPRIHFCGTFPNHTIGSIFADLDALVVPSLWYENSPLVIYSAQAAKCPVIASNMGGMSDVIHDGENGLLFEAGNAKQLEMVLERLLKDRDLVGRLSEHAQPPLSIQGYADELLKIYCMLVRRGQSA